MLVCMKRTTLVLEEGILDGIRAKAHADGRDMSEVVNEILRRGLLQKTKEQPKPMDLPSFSMGKPRVNLADRDALEQLMES